ncbi:MAG: SRPBCC family protein [Anaerolineales bacterium]|nr:SRPBCC family protein [Anaerolineales bacterium]
MTVYGVGCHPSFDDIMRARGLLVRLTTIQISAIKEQIAAPQSRIFEFLTDFGSDTAVSETHSTVLSRDGEKLLVEFKTAVPILFGLQKSFRTVEEVILHEPESIEFCEIQGPLAMRRERIALSEEAGVTHIQYNAEFRVKGWLLGWILGVLFVRPRLKRAVKEHFKEIKTTIELQS